MNKQQISLLNYVENSYFDYANYVIHDRALPFIGDGLKPVARRIIYAMSELSLHHNAKYKKSARTIGDVLGKFHPHGDAACYEAMVLMAQSFSYRYPLVDGQGNWGSIDEPKSFAAMRYTEAKLSNYACSLLSELTGDVVSWNDNFDGSLLEPAFLPARLPNVVLNGAMGIAVGISTDIAPHNVHECVAAILEILDNPNCDDDVVLRHILGPDLPTFGVLITSRDELIEAYKTGSGNYRVRSTYEIVGKNLIITSLPYQVSTSRAMRQIADLVLSKKLSGVEDIRDDSDEQNPVRISLILKNNADCEQIIQAVLSHTDCEKSYRMQQFVLNLEHKPVLMPMRSLLEEWLIFRKNIVRNRIKSNIAILEARLHILDGLKIIALHIDDVIKIIRYEDDPELVLASKYHLTALQVKAILEIRLRQLAKVEWIKLEQEHQQKSAEMAELLKLLSDEKHFNKLIAKELKADAKEFGDARRTQINPQQSALRQSAVKILIPKENIKVFLSQQLWIRSSRNVSLKAETLVYLNSDQPYLDVSGSTDQQLVLWADNGYVFNIPSHSISSVRGKGDHITNWVDCNSVVSLTMCDEQTNILVISTDGYGFITKSEHAFTRLKNGKILLNLPNGQRLHKALPLQINDTHVAILSLQGKLVILDISNIPHLKKGRGVKLISFAKDEIDGVSSSCILSSNSVLELLKNGQSWLQTPKQWLAHVCKRAAKGAFVPRNFRTSAIMSSLEE